MLRLEAFLRLVVNPAVSKKTETEAILDTDSEFMMASGRRILRHCNEINVHFDLPILGHIFEMIWLKKYSPYNEYASFFCQSNHFKDVPQDGRSKWTFISLQCLRVDNKNLASDYFSKVFFCFEKITPKFNSFFISQNESPGLITIMIPISLDGINPIKRAYPTNISTMEN